jgi:hypothetical protein
MAIEIRIKGDAKLKESLKPELYKPVVHEMMRDLGKAGRKAAKAKAPKDTGTLRKKIGFRASHTGLTLFSPTSYARYVELGRRPGARPPPSNALHGWLRRHGIPVSAAYVVARAIGRRGIKGRFFMAAGMAAMKKLLPYDIKKAEKRVAQRFAKGAKSRG